jgi:hypothetical protein
VPADHINPGNNRPGLAPQAYEQIGKLLAELRDAQAGRDPFGLADQRAQTLKNDYPTLWLLVSELRRNGFLAK